MENLCWAPTTAVRESKQHLMRQKCVSMETFLSVNKEHAGPSRKKCDDKSFN